MAEEARDGELGSRRGALIGLVVMVVLVVVVLLLVRVLHRDAAIQDCVEAGRTNCAPISATPK